MSKHLSFFFSFLLLIFAFSGISAQTTLPNNQASSNCRIQIKVYSIDSIKEDNPRSLSGVQVLLRNAAGKPIKATSSGPQYTDLPAGEYEVSASLSGYQPTVKAFRVACDNPYIAPESFIPEVLFLWKNDKTEPMKMASGTFGIKQDATPSQPFVDAVRLGKPVYPPAARRVRAAGTVNIQVTLNELGTVVDARPVSGHPLLFPPAIKAALESKFRPTILQDLPVKVTGVIVYNFTAQ